MQKDNYQIIIHFLEGKLSLKDRKNVAQWRKANPKNEQQFQEIKFLWQRTAVTQKEKMPFKIDVTAALAKVNQQLPETTKVIPLRSRFAKYAAAASVLILMSLMTWMTFFQESEMVQVATLANETKEIRLPDNSTVWLNENSTISYPKVFAQTTRQVRMQGDIIFEVTHQPQQPFIVTTNDLVVKVLGTQFNVQSDADKNTSAFVHVLNGKVQVQKKKAATEKVLLTKGMTAQLAAQTAQLKLTDTFSNNQLFWHHQTLVFAETPLKKVLQTINQAYNTEIELTNQALFACPFTGEFKANTLPEVVKILQLIYEFEVKNIHSNTPQLNNGQCN